MGTNHTISYRAFYKTGGSFTAFPGLLRVTPIRTESSGGAGPFQFGGATLPSMTLETTLAGPSSGWYRAPVYAEIKVDIDGVTGTWERVFSGVLLRRRPNSDATGYVFEAGGWDQRIARVKVQTPLRVYRHLATETTLTSVEDPDDPGYAGGLLNEVFWRAGGRPYAQISAHPNADWYYACDGTSVAPEFSYVDGENAWSEALALAEAAGGQIYMDSFGIVRYTNPLKLAEEVAPVTIRDTYASGAILYDGRVQEEIDLTTAFNVAVCRFQQRGEQPYQEVYNAPFPCPQLGPLEERELPPLVTQWPVAWREETTGTARYEVIVTATDYTGAPVSVGVSVVSETAQTLVIELTNPLNAPVSINRIVIKGHPVSVVHEGEARYVGPRFDANDDEDVERRLADSFYTQSQPAAERRARMAVMFEGTPRPVYRGLRCPYTPGVTVGGYARFYSSRLGISNLPCVIIAKEVTDDGAMMVLDLASTVGLRKLSELWITGETYADGIQRRLGL